MSVVWDDRIARAHAAVPARASAVTWSDTAAVVNGEEVLVRLLRDVLAVDNVEVRRGQRPDPDVDQGRQLLRELRGQDFTISPFPVAFRALAGTRSLENLKRRTGLSRSNLSRLFAGKYPQVAEMEAVADAFNKRPVFFAEYRTHVLCALLAERLSADPDRSAVLTHQLGLCR